MRVGDAGLVYGQLRNAKDILHGNSIDALTWMGDDRFYQVYTNLKLATSIMTVQAEERILCETVLERISPSKKFASEIAQISRMRKDDERNILRAFIDGSIVVDAAPSDFLARGEGQKEKQSQGAGKDGDRPQSLQPDPAGEGPGAMRRFGKSQGNDRPSSRKRDQPDCRGKGGGKS